MDLLTPTPTAKGPADRFTGDVYVDVIARGEDESRLPDRHMTHLALWEDDDVTWSEHVTPAEYDDAARS